MQRYKELLIPPRFDMAFFRKRLRILTIWLPARLAIFRWCRFEVPIHHIVVETDALGAAILSDNLHDFFLLLWREHVFSVVYSVVGAIAATKERANMVASLCLIPLWHMVIKMCEAPCFLHETLLTETLALAVQSITGTGF